MVQRSYEVRPSFGSALLGMLVAGLFLYGLFRLAAWTMSTLISGLPVFFGIGLALGAVAYFVDERVVKSFGRWLAASLERSPLRGLLLAVATVVFAPFVALYLLAKALLLKRVREAVAGAREQTPATGYPAAGGGAIGGRGEGYEEVRRADGLVIRIPKEEA